MKKIALYIFLLSLSLPFNAQSPNLDSLHEVARHEAGISLMQALNDLSVAYLASDPERARQYAEEAMEIARAEKDWEGLASAYDNLGLAFQQKYDHKRAMEAFVEALKIRDENKDEKGKVRSRILVGRVFYQMEEYEQAEESLIKALVLANRTSVPNEHADALTALGDVYLAKKIYGKALDHYSHAVDKKLAFGRIADAASLTFHLGNISMDLGDQEVALTYYQTSLDLHREMNDAANIARTSSRIAQSLIALDALEEAIDYNEEAFRIREELQDTLGMAESLKIFGEIHLHDNNRRLASRYLKESASLLDRLTPVPGIPAIYNDIASAYARMGKYEEAYDYHIAYSNSHLAHFNREKTEALLNLTTKYESEFAAREKQQKIELLEIANANGRRISYFLFAVVGLIGLLLTNVWLSYRRKQKDNELLHRKNEEINRQKDEIDCQNAELEAKNVSLDLLNKKLIDEIGERENIEKSSFARDRFLATMSHEMRTPLNIITGLTHILLENDPRADQAEQLRNLQFSANDLIVFINDVLDFSKIEAGKLNIEDRPFKPVDTINDVRNRFEERAEERGVLMSFFQDQKIPENLLGDDARLNQILTNLLTNAFQCTTEGFVKMDVSLRELKTREAMLEIVVEGSDGGVERRVLKGMFRPMEEEEGEFEGYDGQNFGLTITKRLVELQNGKMEIVVVPGQSTVFKVLLPFKLILPNRRGGQQLNVTDHSGLAGTRILVVEDNKINQLVVTKMLRRMDIVVSTANNGMEALDLFEQKYFDLILMDIQMPVMDGYRATAEIRRHDDVLKRDVPIIALTASAFLTEKEKAVLFGMNDHVGKPFSPEELLEKISNCLEIYRGV